MSDTNGALVRQEDGAEGGALATLPVGGEQRFVNNFVGMATAPFSEKAIAALLAPVDPSQVEIKPDGIVYLPGIHYRNRLIDAFGPGGWALAPRSEPQKLGDLVVYHAALYVSGRFVSEATGECQYHANNRGMSYVSALEGARTDALTRCCKDLGVARELWDPTWRETWIAANANRAWAEVDGKRKQLYWRKDREAPWQVKGKPVEGGRGQAAPQVKGLPPVGGDTGEAPDDAELDAMEAMVFDTLKWPKARAANWLRKYFKTDNPGGLSKAQVGTAMLLLDASKKAVEAADDGVYDAAVEELRKAGRLPPEAA